MALSLISEISGTGNTYTTPGTYYLTIPFGCSQVKINCWGAGGCGGAGSNTAGKWGGGGGGGYAYTTVSNPPPGSVIELIVGAGGTSAGTRDGGDSTATQLAQWTLASGTVYARATGGKGVALHTTTGGANGTGTGDTTYIGGRGATGHTVNGAGGGGGGAGDGGDGTNGGNSAGGSGGTAFGGNGGNGRTGSVGAGSAGAQAGGGGGGAWTDASTTYAGGAGGNGRISYTMDYALNTMVIGSGM